jgi:excisionase family DNA binding protein
MRRVRATGKKENRKCSQCGKGLSMHNPGTLCFVCQDKESEKLTTGDSPTYDVQDMARILRLDDEQVRRLARKGKLPARVPVGRKWLWSREIVDRWIKSDGQLHKESALELAALAALADIHWVRTFDEASGQWKLGDPAVIFPVSSDQSRLKPVIYTLAISEHPESP